MQKQQQQQEETLKRRQKEATDKRQIDKRQERAIYKGDKELRDPELKREKKRKGDSLDAKETDK